MYPDGHPYQWQVIGSLADLEGAELADIADFHSAWYGPDNATLVVAGDLDVEQTKAWIERYFGEIPSREMPAVPEPRPVRLSESVRLFHEDNYARLPMAYRGGPDGADVPRRRVCARRSFELLTDGKAAPFYEVLVEEEELAPAVFAGNQSSELAGRFSFRIRAYAGTDLDDVLAAVDRAFERFESEDVPPDELQRVKAGYETGFYGGIASVLGKAFQLAQYNIFADDPGYMGEDLERLLAVTAEDVMRVYERYVKDQRTSRSASCRAGARNSHWKDRGAPRWWWSRSYRAPKRSSMQLPAGTSRPRRRSSAASSHPYGQPPTLSAPTVWRTELSNGVPVLGVVDDESAGSVRAENQSGQLLDVPHKVGVANLLAETMTEGTASKTSAELEKAIDMLGSTINVTSGTQSFVVSGSTLSRNYGATMALVEEILLEPRFDAEKFSSRGSGSRTRCASVTPARWRSRATCSSASCTAVICSGGFAWAPSSPSTTSRSTTCAHITRAMWLRRMRRSTWPAMSVRTR